MVTMETPVAGGDDPEPPEVACSIAERTGVTVRAGPSTADPLTSRELTIDRRARPNQCGNPWRRLKPPGDNRSSSVALTVSVSEDAVV